VLYKAVVADDERIIRESLRDFINWEDIGLEVVKLCSDGKEVIQFLKDNPVDLILTDIKMVNVSGLEVAKYVFENKMKAKIILLSGYKEFDFAIEAMKYGVNHYILKPTDIDKLEDIIKDVKCQIDKERE